MAGYVNLKIYLSEAEVKMVKRQARKRGLSFPDYIRYLIKRKRTLVIHEKGKSVERLWPKQNNKIKGARDEDHYERSFRFGARGY
jgi:hypothetical protein